MDNRELDRRYEELYTELVAYAEALHDSNKRRIRRGLTALVVMPAVLEFIRWMTGSDKTFFLIIWILAMFALSAYLITVEYLDDYVQTELRNATSREAEFDELLSLDSTMTDVSAAIEERRERRDVLRKRIRERIRERRQASREELEGDMAELLGSAMYNVVRPAALLAESLAAIAGGEGLKPEAGGEADGEETKDLRLEVNACIDGEAAVRVKGDGDAEGRAGKEGVGAVDDDALSADAGVHTGDDEASSLRTEGAGAVDDDALSADAGVHTGDEDRADVDAGCSDIADAESEEVDADASAVSEVNARDGADAVAVTDGPEAEFPEGINEAELREFARKAAELQILRENTDG